MRDTLMKLVKGVVGGKEKRKSPEFSPMRTLQQEKRIIRPQPRPPQAYTGGSIR